MILRRDQRRIRQRTFAEWPLAKVEMPGADHRELGGSRLDHGFGRVHRRPCCRNARESPAWFDRAPLERLRGIRSLELRRDRLDVCEHHALGLRSVS
ncbi:MAG TPA: hypothetical protein VFS15_04660 [Kofleriaceae bacterium]|nr:hypothetical protein [Kofleriaceae bacterium]